MVPRRRRAPTRERFYQRRAPGAKRRAVARPSISGAATTHAGRCMRFRVFDLQRRKIPSLVVFAPVVSRHPLLLVGLSLLASCSGRARERVWADLELTQQRWYQLAWGTRMDPAQLAERRRSFDCVWDALDDAGRDPAPDFACFARRMDAHRACMANDPTAALCTERVDSECALPDAYVRAAESCASADARTP